MFSCQVRNQSVEKGSWPLEGDLPAISLYRRMRRSQERVVSDSRTCMRAPMRMSMAARSIWRDSLSTLLAGALAVAAGAAAVPGSAAAVATEVLMRVSRKAQISKEDDDPAAAGPPQGGWGPLWGAATTRSEGAWGLTGSRPSGRP